MNYFYQNNNEKITDQIDFKLKKHILNLQEVFNIYAQRNDIENEYSNKWYAIKDKMEKKIEKNNPFNEIFDFLLKEIEIRMNYSKSFSNDIKHLLSNQYVNNFNKYINNLKINFDSLIENEKIILETKDKYNICKNEEKILKNQIDSSNLKNKVNTKVSNEILNNNLLLYKYSKNLFNIVEKDNEILNFKNSLKKFELDLFHSLKEINLQIIIFNLSFIKNLEYDFQKLIDKVKQLEYKDNNFIKYIDKINIIDDHIKSSIKNDYEINLKYFNNEEELLKLDNLNYYNISLFCLFNNLDFNFNENRLENKLYWNIHKLFYNKVSNYKFSHDNINYIVLLSYFNFLIKNFYENNNWELILTYINLIFRINNDSLYNLLLFLSVEDIKKIIIFKIEVGVNKKNINIDLLKYYIYFLIYLFEKIFKKSEMESVLNLINKEEYFNELIDIKEYDTLRDKLQDMHNLSKDSKYFDIFNISYIKNIIK